MKNTPRYISLLSDYGFKIVFADETDTVFLRKAIQALIKSRAKIKKVSFLSNEFIGLTAEARGGLFDLICEDEKGQIFIVEMQLGYYKHFLQRAKFYAFQKFNTLVKKGNYKFKNLTKIYCIGFVAKSIFRHSEEYYHYATLKNQKGEILDNQITHIIVEIDKFNKQASQIKSNLDKLIYVMKNLQAIKGLDELPKVLTDDWIKIAMKKLDTSSMTPEQRMSYEIMMARNGSIIEMQEMEREEMRKEVKKEFIEKAEKEVLTMAVKLKNMKVAISNIAEATGLPIEVIEKL